MGESSAPSALLRVQGSSRLAFGATTAALVTLASGGTAFLVTHATDVAVTPTALPPGALGGDRALDGGGLVVDHAAGFVPVPVAAEDPSERALREALARRAEPGRRVPTAPLVPIAPPAAVTPPVTVPVAQPTSGPTSGPTLPPGVSKGPAGGGTGSSDGEQPGDHGHGRPHTGPGTHPGPSSAPGRPHDGHPGRGKHARVTGKGKHAR